jgi:hypothetical protein
MKRRKNLKFSKIVFQVTFMIVLAGEVAYYAGRFFRECS